MQLVEIKKVVAYLTHRVLDVSHIEAAVFTPEFRTRVVRTGGGGQCKTRLSGWVC